MRKNNSEKLDMGMRKHKRYLIILYARALLIVCNFHSLLGSYGERPPNSGPLHGSQFHLLFSFSFFSARSSTAGEKDEGDNGTSSSAAASTAGCTQASVHPLRRRRSRWATLFREQQQASAFGFIDG